jgi:histidyl-tRNA synthetase
VRNKQALIDAESALTLLAKDAERRFPHLLGEADKQANTSMYYGFTPIKTPEIKQDDIAKARQFMSKLPSDSAAQKKEAGALQAASRPAAACKPSWTPEEKIALLRTYAENGMQSLPQPVMFYYKKPFPSAGLRRSGKQSRETQFGLDIIGTPQAIGEALIIQATHSILEEDGFKSLVVEVNSVGDREAMLKHERELGLYFKKHAHALPPQFKAAFKCSPIDMLTSTEPECQAFCEGAPKSVSYLGEAGRKHFMEVLEYLETLEIPYRINHGLLGVRHFSSHVLFEIKHVEEDKETTLAVGSRYTHLSKKLGFKKELPAIGASIHYKRLENSDDFKAIAPPKFFFIQFGNDARRKSLKVIDMLRRERIAVHHSLAKDKLLPQMNTAEKLKVPFILIMGQKEALENTVVVRDINTRAQETIGIQSLVGYLKKLK